MKKKTVRPAKKVAKKKTTKATRMRKPKDIVIVSPVDPSTSFVVASELADDQLIEAELTGEILPHFIYQYCENKPACKPDVVQAGKCPHHKTTGMSTKGVNEVVRRLNKDPKSGAKIREAPEHLRIDRNAEVDGEKGVEVAVFAENLLDGNSAWGIKFEPYKKQGRNGTYSNTFALEKALSKAERNAKRKLIPEVAATKIIQKLLNTPNAVLAIAAPPQYQQKPVTPVQPKPTTPEQYEQQVLDYISRSKRADTVIQLDVQTQASDKFTPEAKVRIHAAASSKVDQLS